MFSVRTSDYALLSGISVNSSFICERILSCVSRSLMSSTPQLSSELCAVVFPELHEFQSVSDVTGTWLNVVVV